MNPRIFGPVSAAALRTGAIAGSLLVVGLLLDQIGFPIRHVFLVLSSSVVLSAAISPAVAFLQRWRVPKAAAILLIYMAVAALFAGVILTLIPLVSNEVHMLTQQVPRLVERLKELAEHWQITAPGAAVDSLSPHITEALTAAAHSLQQLLQATIKATISIVLVLVISFFMTMEQDFLFRASSLYMSDEQRPGAQMIVERVHAEIGRWATAQMIIAVSFGTSLGLGLAVIGLPFAKTVGFIGVVLEFIPFGGVVAITLAALIALTQENAGMLLLLVGGLAVLILELKDYILVPKLMESRLGIHKVVIVVAVFSMAETFGVMGAMLAVPSVICARVLLAEWHKASQTTESVGMDRS